MRPGQWKRSGCGQARLGERVNGFFFHFDCVAVLFLLIIHQVLFLNHEFEIFDLRKITHCNWPRERVIFFINSRGMFYKVRVILRGCEF